MNNAKRLAEKVRNLNPRYLKLGAGTMAEMQMLAGAVLSDIKSTQDKRFFISVEFFKDGAVCLHSFRVFYGEIPMDAKGFDELVTAIASDGNIYDSYIIKALNYI